MAYQNQKVKARQTVAQSNSQTKDLGIVSEVPMGEWNATTQYQKLNKVRYVSTGGSGVTLLAKKQNQGEEPFVSQGWQEVWMVENYDGSAVIPNGTYPDMTVGNATNAKNDGAGNNIANQFETIESYFSSDISADNQAVSKNFVNSSINNSAAFYITSNAQGDAFATKSSLLAATIFYSGGQPRIPTQNDYATVLSDESQPAGVNDTYPTTRYTYQTNTQNGQYPNGQWELSMVVNNTTLTQAQLDAINSGITKELVEEIGKGGVTSVNGQTGEVTITPASIGAVNKAGDTMTGDLTVEKPSSGARFIAKTTKNGEGIQIGVNGDDASTGIWDLKRSKWILQNKEGDIYIDNKLPMLVDTTKLNPNTSNGWTVGTRTLVLPSAGIYLVTINTSSPFLFVYAGRGITHAVAASVDGAVYSVEYAGDLWSISGKTITSVAYKKIA